MKLDFFLTMKNADVTLFIMTLDQTRSFFIRKGRKSRILHKVFSQLK